MWVTVFFIFGKAFSEQTTEISKHYHVSRTARRSEPDKATKRYVFLSSARCSRSVSGEALPSPETSLLIAARGEGHKVNKCLARMVLKLNLREFYLIRFYFLLLSFYFFSFLRAFTLLSLLRKAVRCFGTAAFDVLAIAFHNFLTGTDKIKTMSPKESAWASH